jgi:hypothetical protein
MQSMRRIVLVLGLLLTVVAGACGEEVKPVGRVVYTITRIWSNGTVENGEVYGSGALVMTHGDHTEKLQLPKDQMAELAAAAALGVAAGSSSDDPIIGISISGGDEVKPASLQEGSIAELLNTLLDSHTLRP